MADLKRVKRTITTPGEAEETIRKRLKTLDMNFQQYVASLILYDLWAEKPHALTGDSCRAGRDEEQILWGEAILDYGKPDKVGSFFEHRLEDIARKRAGDPE